MNKLIKILKQLIYWATVIMPVIDGVKTVAQCIENGIEQGKAESNERYEKAQKAKFDDANSNVEITGVAVSYDPNLFRGDDAK